jgi:mxaJ protein
MISMGVRKGNTELRDRLNQFLSRRRPEIERLLRSFGTPMLPIGNVGSAQQARLTR